MVSNKVQNPIEDLIPLDELDAVQRGMLEFKGKGFDYRTHIFDRRKGILLRKQPYTKVISREAGTYLIRDGKRYSEQGLELSAGESSAYEAPGKKKG